MSLKVQGVDVFFQERGAGEPILFLHGAPDSAEMWDGVIAELEGVYRCIALDLPGFGRSQAPAHFDCSLEGMARFVEAFIKEAGISTPLHLVVADFGATYGLSWAVNYPEKVKSVIVAGSSNFSSRYRWHKNARLFRTPLIGELIMRTLTLASYEKSMRQSAPLLGSEYIRSSYALSASKPETRRMMLKLYRSIEPADFVGKEERLQELLQRIPALVLWGDKDPFISPDYAQQFGRAQVIHFPDNGHWLAVEAATQVGQEIMRFLARQAA